MLSTSTSSENIAYQRINSKSIEMEKRRLEVHKKALSDRKVVAINCRNLIASGEFTAQKLNDIEKFLKNPYLGETMRLHLEKCKNAILTNKNNFEKKLDLCLVDSINKINQESMKINILINNKNQEKG